MTTAIGQLLRQKRLQTGLPQNFVAKKGGCHRTYLNRIENKPNFTKKVSDKILDRIALALGTSISELLGDKPKKEQEIKPALKPLPIVGYANRNSSHKKTHDLGTFARVEDLTDPAAYAVILSDASMKPIQRGSIIVVSPAIPLKENTLMVVKTQGKYLFKNYQTQGDNIILNALQNPNDLTIISKKDVDSIHRVWGMTIKT